MLKKVSSVIAIFLLFFSASVYGGVVYPGASGVTSAYGPQPSIVFGTMSNPSETEWLGVTLPVNRSSYNGSRLRGWIKVVDTSDDYNFFAYMCTVFRTDAGGYYVWHSQDNFSFGSGKNVQTLEFSPLGGLPSSYTFFRVLIPPAQKTGNQYGPHIISYYVSEN